MENNPELINLSKDEVKVLLTMRKFGPYASFKVEKRPTRDKPLGELLHIVTENKTIVKNYQVV